MLQPAARHGKENKYVPPFSAALIDFSLPSVYISPFDAGDARHENAGIPI
jgi:hypothetical protein